MDKTASTYLCEVSASEILCPGFLISHRNSSTFLNLNFLFWFSLDKQLQEEACLGADLSQGLPAPGTSEHVLQVVFREAG